MTLEFDAGVPGRVDAAFTLPTGRTLALIGANGAGKSSTIALIAGLLQPERGSIRLGGRVLSSAQPSRAVPPHQRRIATLGQDPLLFPHLTARANIAFPLRARGRTRRAADTEARTWLERLALTELSDRRPDQLSGGQAARVALARALAAEPELLLLDEPMAAVDAAGRPALRQQVRELTADRTTVVVTHDLLDVLLLADDVVVLADGQVAEVGSVAEVMRRPRSDFAATLAGLNLVRGEWRGACVEAGGLCVFGEVAPPGPAPGERAIALFRPSSVAVFTSPPGGSLRNVLPVTVETLQTQGDRVRVSGGGLHADITPAAVADLGLRPGDEVYFAAKATEVSVHRG